MNSKEYLENALTLTKSLTTLYLNGAIESSNKDIHKLMNDGLTNTLAMQHNLYTQMENDGYYEVCTVNQIEIDKLNTKIEGSAS